MKKLKNIYFVLGLFCALTGKHYGAAEVRAATAFPQSPFTTKCTASNAVINWDIIKDVLAMAGGANAVASKISDRLLPCLNNQNQNFTNNFLDQCRKDQERINQIPARVALCKGEKDKNNIMELLNAQSQNISLQSAPSMMPQAPVLAPSTAPSTTNVNNNTDLLARIEKLEQQMQTLTTTSNETSGFIMGPLKQAFSMLLAQTKNIPTSR